MAATEKEAVCPAATDWLAGWVVIEGAVATEPVVLDASPEQPPEKTPSWITTKTKLKRFMHCLFQEVSPARHLLAKSRKSAGSRRRVLPSACVETGPKETIGGRTAGRQLLVRPENGL